MKHTRFCEDEKCASFIITVKCKQDNGGSRIILSTYKCSNFASDESVNNLYLHYGNSEAISWYSPICVRKINNFQAPLCGARFQLFRRTRAIDKGEQRALVFKSYSDFDVGEYVRVLLIRSTCLGIQFSGTQSTDLIYILVHGVGLSIRFHATQHLFTKLCALNCWHVRRRWRLFEYWLRLFVSQCKLDVIAEKMANDQPKQMKNWTHQAWPQNENHSRCLRIGNKTWKLRNACENAPDTIANNFQCWHDDHSLSQSHSFTFTHSEFGRNGIGGLHSVTCKRRMGISDACQREAYIGTIFR